MRFRGAHAGFARQVLECHRLSAVGEGAQQLATDLDALDAALAAGDRFRRNER